VKDLIFFGGLLLCIPVGTVLAAYSRRARDLAFGALVFGTTLSDRLDINFLSCEWYRGTTRGIEVSFVDFLALSVLLGAWWAARRERFRPFWPSSMFMLLAYLIYSCINVALSEPRLFGLFELTKIVRGVIVFLAAAYFVRGRREVNILLWAICIAVAFESGVALRDRYVLGMHRISATLNHPNILSMYSCIAVGLLIPQALSTAPARLRALYGVCATLAAGCVILSVSRMGVLTLAVVASVAVFSSVGLRLTVRNVVALGVVAILAGGMFARSWKTLADRYEAVSLETEYFDEDSGGRGLYFRQLVPIIRERFFGVGLNNWSYWVSLKYGAEIGARYTAYDGVNGAPSGYQAAPAHNVGVLTIGELGWPGLLLLGCIWAQWFWMGAVFLVRQRPDVVTRYGTGAFCAMLAIFLQSLTEWEFRNTKIFLLAHIIMGALAAIYFANRHVRKDGVADSLALFKEVLLRSRQETKRP
jgi:hypothetical protein